MVVSALLVSSQGHIGPDIAEHIICSQISHILISLQIVKPSFKAGRAKCYYRFNKLSPLKLQRGKKAFIIKDWTNISAHISQIYDLPQTARAEITAEESLWLCKKIQITETGKDREKKGWHSTEALGWIWVLDMLWHGMWLRPNKPPGHPR